MCNAPNTGLGTSFPPRAGGADTHRRCLRGRARPDRSGLTENQEPCCWPAAAVVSAGPAESSPVHDSGTGGGVIPL